MCSGTCEVMRLCSATVVLGGWQTFAFSLAHVLLLSFVLSWSSMCEVMHIRSERCTPWMVDASIFCCTHSSVWRSPLGGWLTFRFYVAKQELCWLSSVKGKRFHFILHTLFRLNFSLRCITNYTSQSGGTASVKRKLCWFFLCRCVPFLKMPRCGLRGWSV